MSIWNYVVTAHKPTNVTHSRVGNFTNTHDINLIIEEELVKECLEKGTRLVQALADKLFSLPSIPSKEGPLVQLPTPTTPIPREKPLPKSKPPTKWEVFAQSKGVEFKLKLMTIGGKMLKLTIWDTGMWSTFEIEAWG